MIGSSIWYSTGNSEESPQRENKDENRDLDKYLRRALPLAGPWGCFRCVRERTYARTVGDH